MEENKSQIPEKSLNKRTKKDLASEIGEKNEKIRILESELEETQEKLGSLETKTENLDEKISNLEQEKEDLVNQDEAIKREINDWEKKYHDLDRKGEENQRKFKEKLNTLEKEKKKLQNDIKKLQEKFLSSEDNFNGVDQSKKAIFRLEFWLEEEPIRGRISKTLSPHKINLNGFEKEKILEFISKNLPGSKKSEDTVQKSGFKEETQEKLEPAGKKRNGVSIKQIKLIQNKKVVDLNVGLKANYGFQIEVLLEFEKSITRDFDYSDRFFDIRALVEDKKKKKILVGNSDAIELQRNQTNYTGLINMPALNDGVYNLLTFTFIPHQHIKSESKAPNLKVKSM